MITMEDIARICGVSRQTVHVALTGKPGVSEPTRERILEIVKKYNYRPNRMATTLLQKNTNLVGVTILNIRNPFFADLIQGINSVLRKEGLHIIFFETQTKEAEEEAIEDLLAYQVAGLILSPFQMEGRLSHYESLRLRKTPFVCVGPIRGFESHFVEVENREVGYLAAEHCIEKGHTNLCYLEGPEKIVSAAERAVGFVQCLMESGVNFNSQCVVKAGDTTQQGFEAGLKVLDVPSRKRPTAVVCFNDMIALGVYEAAQHLGLKIPEDVSVVGCDDIEIARLLNPPMTTIALPIAEMGRSAAEILVSQLQGAESEGYLVKRFPPELVARDSVRSL
ncbi:LacI family transcriptional regulator [bacterium]|nr:LacI family transcriptional regulator [bacterium]